VIKVGSADLAYKGADMAIPSRLVGAGLPPLAANTICGDATTGLVALGTNNTNAVALGATINVVATTAVGTGGLLPTPEVGSNIVVVNEGANALLVYPGTGARINALVVTTGGFSIPTGRTVMFIGSTGVNWYALLSA